MAARRFRAGVKQALSCCGLSLSLLSCGHAPPGEAFLDTGTGAPPTVEIAPAASAAEPAALAPVAPAAVEEPGAFPEPDFARAKVVYRRRCAFCHGERGDGKGPAAAALWPRPRAFVEEPFRFVSTDNGLPTEADVFQVISNGMPGSAMPPWRKLLSEADRRELARYLLWLPKPALFDKEIKRAEERRSRGKEAPSVKEMLKRVDAATAPGRVITLPPKPAFSAEIAERGTEIYVQNCKPCHGARGDGGSQQELKDSLGRTIRPRSYNHAYYKGGYPDEQIALRILAGIPGSPMPSFAAALKDPADVWPLVYRVRQFEHRAHGAVGRGRLLFHQRGCASCHGIDGRGEIPNENYLTGTVRALNVVAKRMLIPDAEAAKLVVEALSKGTLATLSTQAPYPRFNVTLAQYEALTNVIKNGNPAGLKDPKGVKPTFDMPSWKGELGDKQIDEILAYLISLQPWEDEEG